LAKRKKKAEPEPAAVPAAEVAVGPEPETPTPPQGNPAGPPRARVSCPVCDGPGEDGPCEGLSTCGDCGSVFLGERPSKGELARIRDERFKETLFKPGPRRRPDARERALQVMRGYFLELYGKPAALNGFNRGILEVNCGPGLRLRAFQDYGWTVAGTETSAVAFKYAGQKRLDVAHGWPVTAGLGGARFDLALLCGCLGEIPGVRDLVGWLAELLKPGGLVCVKDEPLVPESVEPPRAETEPVETEPVRLVEIAPPSVYRFTADAVRKLFCRDRFAFVSEEFFDGTGTFWFQVRERR